MFYLKENWGLLKRWYYFLCSFILLLIYSGTITLQLRYMINGFIYILCLDLFQHKIIRVQNSQISLKGNVKLIVFSKSFYQLKKYDGYILVYVTKN
jgi:hypothetical protein